MAEGRVKPGSAAARSTSPARPASSRASAAAISGARCASSFSRAAPWKTSSHSPRATFADQARVDGLHAAAARYQRVAVPGFEHAHGLSDAHGSALHEETVVADAAGARRRWAGRLVGRQREHRRGHPSSADGGLAPPRRCAPGRRRSTAIASVDVPAPPSRRGAGCRQSSSCSGWQPISSTSSGGGRSARRASALPGSRSGAGSSSWRRGSAAWSFSTSFSVPGARGRSRPRRGISRRRAADLRDRVEPCVPPSIS